MLEVTPSATKAIKEFMSERNISSPLRIYLQSGG